MLWKWVNPRNFYGPFSSSQTVELPGRVYPKMLKKWHQNLQKCWKLYPPFNLSCTAHIDITPPKLAARPRNSMSQTWRWKQSPLDSTSSDRAECWSNLLKWWSFSLEITTRYMRYGKNEFLVIWSIWIVQLHMIANIGAYMCSQVVVLLLISLNILM